MPFCQVHCPLQNNIPDWLKLTAEGRLEEAYELSQATNNMPEICGRICPQDRLCEGNCVIEQSGHGTVTIGAVEKYLTDTAWAERLGEAAEAAPRARPSMSASSARARRDLAAAEELRRKGYRVTVYDRHDRAGGLLIYGIPNFKLEKDVVAAPREAARRWRHRIQAEFRSRPRCVARRIARATRCACSSPPASTSRARSKRRASALDRIVPALDYLIASNRKGLGDACAGVR